MIWEPFVLALFLGLVVSAGLYFAYLWPSVEPEIEPALAGVDSRGKPDVVAPSVPELPAATTAAEPAAKQVAPAKPDPEPVVAPPKLPDPLPEKKAGPPTRPSDGDLTPLPPPQPEDDGLGNDGKAS